MAASRMKLLQNQREAQMRSGPSRRWCCHSGRRGGSGRAPWRRATCCWISSRRTGWPGPGGFLSSGISIERAHEECRGIGVQDAGASPPLPSSGSGLETDVPFSGSCKRVFEVAVEFSRNIGCSFISLDSGGAPRRARAGGRPTLNPSAARSLRGSAQPPPAAARPQQALAAASAPPPAAAPPQFFFVLRHCPWSTSPSRSSLSSLSMIPPPTISSGGIRVGVLSIYKLRAFRRETLLWINLLNKVSTPLSISIMSNSSVCNCSSSHATLFFWNVWTMLICLICNFFLVVLITSWYAISYGEQDSLYYSSNSEEVAYQDEEKKKPCISSSSRPARSVVRHFGTTSQALGSSS